MTKVTKKFKIISKWKPAGDQPEAIQELVKGLSVFAKATPDCAS